MSKIKFSTGGGSGTKSKLESVTGMNSARIIAETTAALSAAGKAAVRQHHAAGRIVYGTKNGVAGTVDPEGKFQPRSHTDKRKGK